MSPELALVDETFAERLRADLDHPMEPVRPVRRDLRVVPSEPTAAEIEYHPEEVDPLDASDLLVIPDAAPEPGLVDPLPSAGVEVASTGAELVDDASDLIVVADDVTEQDRPVEPLLSLEMELPTAGAAEALVDASGLIVDPLEDDAADPTTTWYPVLPAPVSGPDTLDAAETALREIRERLTTPPPAAPRRRRFRARFTIASGMCTLCALGVLATNAYFGVTQLPL